MAPLINNEGENRKGSLALSGALSLSLSAFCTWKPRDSGRSGKIQKGTHFFSLFYFLFFFIPIAFISSASLLFCSSSLPFLSPPSLSAHYPPHSIFLPSFPTQLRRFSAALLFRSPHCTVHPLFLHNDPSHDRRSPAHPFGSPSGLVLIPLQGFAHCRPWPC